jgi:hypothetical protein
MFDEGHTLQCIYILFSISRQGTYFHNITNINIISVY